MWKHSESTCKPNAIDSTSSQAVVYIRRNFRFVESNDEERPAVWQYEETTIPKEIYGIIEEHNNVLADIEEALVELAQIVTEGGNSNG